MLEEAIQTYHELLADQLAADSQAQLDDQLRRRGLFFGERPLCTVLRPRFLTPAQYRFIQQQTQVLLSAFGKIQDRAMTDPPFRSQFGLLEWEDKLVQLDPGFKASSPTSRLDAFFLPAQRSLQEQDREETGRDRLYFTEYNAETPAAAAYCDVLADVFLGLPIIGKFLRQYQIQPLPARHGVLHGLLEAYRQWAGQQEAPRIAILDWREVPTYSEFRLFEDYFQSQGLECMIADPREVEYRQGRLMWGDFHITLIYKRVLISELIEWGGLDQPVVRAVQNRAVCLVNPFRCKLLYKKASLAVLSDERNAGLFNAAERQAIADSIPWTRRVEERHTLYRNQTVDLLPFILEQRQQFVLKPNDAYGGKGIVLGWEVTAETWQQAIQAALAEPAIVQERVPLPREPYPSMVNGQVQVIERQLDIAPFAVNGEYIEGCLTRLSTEALINVTAGGGSTVPTFVIDRR